MKKIEIVNILILFFVVIQTVDHVDVPINQWLKSIFRQLAVFAVIRLIEQIVQNILVDVSNGVIKVSHLIVFVRVIREK